MRRLLSKPHALAAGISLACLAFGEANAASIELGGGDQLSLKKLNVSTSGDNEPVLLVDGAAASAKISDSTFSTSGRGSSAAQVLAGEAILSNVTVTTTGANASALAANGVDSLISVSTGTVQTQGDNAHGATLGSGAKLALDSVDVITQGAGARGVNATGTSTLGLVLSTIATQGRAADGLYLRGTSDQQRASATLVDSLIQTTGDSAKGINANRDSQVDLQRTSINTAGQVAHGLWAASATSQVLAQDVHITTSGISAIGAFAQSGATIDLQKASVETFGDNAHGLYADNGSTLTGTDIDIHTHGMSAGVFAVGSGARINLNNALINIDGSGMGIVSYGPAHVLAQGLTLNADGEGARGLLLQDGGSMSLADALVHVRGEDSAAVRSLSRTGQINVLHVQDSDISAQHAAFDISGGLRLELLNSSVAGEQVLRTSVRELADGSLVDNQHVSVAAVGSTLQGDILVEGQDVGVMLKEQSALRGSISGLQQLELDNSLWLMTADSNVGTLDQQNGHVVFDPSLSGTFKTLTVNEDLTGSGRFDMRTDLATLQGDLLRVNGQISGRHTLLIEDSGHSPSGPGQQLRVVDGNGGSGTFGLYGEHVDAGAFRYTLNQQGDDWFLSNSSVIQPPVDPESPSDPVDPKTPTDPLIPPVDPEKPTDPITPPITPPVTVDPGPANLSKGANAAISAQTAGATLWSAQMNALVKRLGELRMGKDEGGIWTRAIGRRFEVAEGSSRAFTQNVTGMEVGVDKAFALGAGKLYVGGVVGGAHSTMNFGEGASGNVDSRMIGTYATYLHDSGVYVDTVAKYSRFDNEIKTPTNLGNPVKGAYTSHGVGMDVEIGRHIALEKGWFVEPQIEVTATHTTGGDYTASNGLRVDADDMNSLQSRVGSLFGRRMTLGNGIEVQPYAKASWITEHAGASTVKVNGTRLKAEVPGDRLELGFGGIVQVSERSKIALDAEFAKGHDIKQPWGLTLGYRYLW